MKRILLAVLISTILLAVSCFSAGAVTDNTFNGVYDKYSSRLILDGAQNYIVKSGDTLGNISISFYGSYNYYPVIMLASRDVVLDPDKIQPGMELIIPDLQRNLNDAAAKPAIKGILFDCADIENSRGRKANYENMKAVANDL